MEKSTPSSPLLDACAAFERELRRYEQLVQKLAGLDLDSEKALVRAERMMDEAVASELRLSEHLTRLAAALSGSRDRQQGCLEARVAASQAALARREDRRELLERFASLGAHAERVNAPLAALMGPAGARSEPGALLRVLEVTGDEMSALIAEAEELADAARVRSWTDLWRQADAIKQQTQAARNQVLLAARSVATNAPS